MDELRLAKLPDRTPVKLTLRLAPELHRDLMDYTELYQRAYGQAEPLAEIVPAMLAAFLEGDRGFARRRKERGR